jgi:cytosine/creatinine deaminase
VRVDLLHSFAPVDILIHGALLTDDDAPMDVAIDRGTIIAIERRIEAPARRVIDAGGRATIPGLVEPHIHLDKALLESRMPNHSGTLEEAIRVTGILKRQQTRGDVLDRSRRVLDLAVRHGTVAIRCHPDVDPIQGLIGVETALTLKEEYAALLDLQVVAFPQEGILKSPGTLDLMREALRLGADVVGGCPYNERTWEDACAHVDTVFELACEAGLDIDMHADFADDSRDPRFAAAAYIARRTIETGYQGRVTLGHVTSLAALGPNDGAGVIALLSEARIHIVTLPATDLYLGGRTDPGWNRRRALTPVRALRDAGVTVAFSSNNIRNAFTPFGCADPLQIGLLLAHAAQLGSPDDQAFVRHMCTYAAADAMGIGAGYGIGLGKRADLIVAETYRVADVLLDLPPRSWVIKRGVVTVETQHRCQVYHPLRKDLAS